MAIPRMPITLGVPRLTTLTGPLRCPSRNLWIAFSRISLRVTLILQASNSRYRNTLNRILINLVVLAPNLTRQWTANGKETPQIDDICILVAYLKRQNISKLRVTAGRFRLLLRPLQRQPTIHPHENEKSYKKKGERGPEALGGQ